MLYVVVNGFWSTRDDSLGDIADRWLATLTGLKGLDAASFDTWHEAGEDLPTDPVLRPSASVLAEYIARTNTGPDLDVVGYSASLWAQNSGRPRVVTAIRAGGSSPYITHSISLTFRSRAVDESDEVIRRAPEILRLLADTWGIDAGQVYNKSQYRAVSEAFGLANSDPRCGRAVYLSPQRAALAPDALPGTYTRTTGGGLVIDLTRGGTETPSNETIIAANRELRAAGTLNAPSAPPG